MSVAYVLEDHGTVWLVRPLDSESADLLQRTAPPDALFFCGALAVEPRYVPEVALALGLIVASGPVQEARL